MRDQSAGRMRFPPRGLLGGADGSYGAIEVNGEGIAPSNSPNVTFHEGDIVCLRLPGGGSCSQRPSSLPLIRHRPHHFQNRSAVALGTMLDPGHDAFALDCISEPMSAARA